MQYSVGLSEAATPAVDEKLCGLLDLQMISYEALPFSVSHLATKAKILTGGTMRAALTTTIIQEVAQVGGGTQVASWSGGTFPARTAQRTTCQHRLRHPRLRHPLPLPHLRQLLHPELLLGREGPGSMITQRLPLHSHGLGGGSTRSPGVPSASPG